MSKLTLRAITIAVIVAAVAALAYVAATSLTSYSKEIPTRITQWHGRTEVENVALERCNRRCIKRRGRIKHWHVRTHSGSAFRGDCRRISTVSAGGNAFDRSIVRFGMSSSWCWKRGKVVRYKLNTWGEADGWALWDYQGVENLVKHCGDGRVHCGRVYRRAYGKFRRGLGSLSQNETTWIAHSVRPGGRYDVDKR